EAAHHPEREHVVAHRIDEGAAELAVFRAGSQRPAQRVDDPAQRPANAPDLLDPERPDLRVRAPEPEPLDRGAGQMALRSLGEDGDASDDVGARLEVRQLLAVSAAALVAGADAADAAMVDEKLRRRGLGQDHRAGLLGLVGQPAAELGERGYAVAVVPHRRRRRDPYGSIARQEVDGLLLDGPVERHLVKPLASSEEPLQRAWVDDGAG